MTTDNKTQTARSEKKRAGRSGLLHFLHSMKIFFCRNKPSVISYLALTLALFLSLRALCFLLDVWVYFDNMVFIRRLADCMLLALPVFFFRKRILVCSYCLLAMMYFLSNIWYYRNYASLMPLSSFTLLENVSLIGNSVLASIKQSDLRIVLPIVAFMVFYCVYGKKVQRRNWATRVMLSIIPLIFIESAVVPLYMSHDYTGQPEPYTNFKLDKTKGFVAYGVINLWIYSIETSRPVSSADKTRASDFLRSYKNDEDYRCNIIENRGQNLIVVLCESLQSWMVEAEVEGIDVMPNLKSLAGDTSLIYLHKVLPQVRDGRSSDAQLMTNTGLLPVETGATSSLYGSNDYPGLPKALRNKGYTSYNLTGDHETFWNQSATTKSYGFDQLYSRLDGGLKFPRADESITKKGLEIIIQQQQPFYAQLATLSMHDKLEMPDRPSRLRETAGLDKDLCEYLVIAEYTDSCIGAFIDGLKSAGLLNNSVIIITGDHHYVTYNNFEKRKRTELSDMFVPLIIINSPLELQPGDKDKVYAQMDIFPSILDMMGVADYSFNGLGHSIFRNHPGGAVLLDGSSIGLPRQEMADSLRELWHISDILIRSNYFKDVDTGK